MSDVDFHWSEYIKTGEFKAIFAELNSLNGALNKIVAAAIKFRSDWETHKRQTNAPKLGLVELGRQLDHYPRALGILNWPISNQQTSPQTPPEPQPKAEDNEES